MESVKYVTEQKQTSYPIFGHVRSDGNKINDDDEKATIWNSFRSCFNVSHPSLEVQGALNLWISVWDVSEKFHGLVRSDHFAEKLTEC